MQKFHGKTVFITGASRGIGYEIGMKLASQGANIVIASKTDKPHPKLPGTIHTAAADMEAAGGKALPLVVDVRSEEMVEEAVERTIYTFGGLDILINNASAIQLTPTLETPMKTYDLMHSVNVRGTYLTSQKCIPYLEQSSNPHILNLSPPLNMEEKWFKNHVAYTMAKYGMSMCVLGMAGELKEKGIGVNALWPRTTIATSALNIIGGEEMKVRSRFPKIVADAAFFVLQRKSRETTGNFYIDDEVLESEGINDLSAYSMCAEDELLPDFFVNPRRK